MNTAEVCIPAAAVALEGVTPSLGDPVSFQAEGVVTRVAGDQIYVRLSAVNGQPVDGAAAPAAGAEPDGDEAATRDVGRQYDEQEALL